MEKTSKIFLLLLFSLSFLSCSLQPEPIVYGQDACQYCKMTIVSKAHSAQIVTSKGKQFKYDAIECLVKDILEYQNENDLAKVMVADYSDPGTMLEVNTAVFIISDAINSPMGANLAALKNADDFSDPGKSAVFKWQELKDHFLLEDSISLKDKSAE
ncbi:nitrous oxide reductase accessory protein NosL [Salegentibacter chungangensis]|uniref:Nitrous oxide reductase accessory protein NosL n=1 Tax=Salegentibacter chungangensis TaxID=1335724 RepID=A0ABW3NS24_9FLAO